MIPLWPGPRRQLERKGESEVWVSFSKTPRNSCHGQQHLELCLLLTKISAVDELFNNSASDGRSSKDRRSFVVPIPDSFRQTTSSTGQVRNQWVLDRSRGSQASLQYTASPCGFHWSSRLTVASLLLPSRRSAVDGHPSNPLERQKTELRSNTQSATPSRGFASVVRTRKKASSGVPKSGQHGLALTATSELGAT